MTDWYFIAPHAATGRPLAHTTVLHAVRASPWKHVNRVQVENNARSMPSVFEHQLPTPRHSS